MHLKKRWINRQVYEYFAVNIAPLLGWRDPILVYQMGKVGSSSVRNSLFRCPDPPTRLVLMSHEFYPIRNRDPARIIIEPEYRDCVLREMEHDRRIFESYSPARQLRWMFRKIFYTQRIYQAYIKPGRPVHVITMVRDPVAINISLFFQVFHQYTGIPIDQAGHSVEQMMDIFIRDYFHYRPLIWLDAELKTMLGIDVYQQPFPREQGHLTLTRDNVSLLILKCELPDSIKSRAIADFLQLDKFEMVRSNVTAEKPHAGRYAEFKRCIRLPEPLLDAMYESKYARFFYTREERAVFRACWSGKRDNPGMPASAEDSRT